MRALICDDDRAIRLTLRRLLEGYFRCDIIECRHGKEALDALHAGGIDFALLDLSMPVMDGIEVLTAIRRSAATKDMPVIILSSESDHAEIAKVVGLGVSDYVLKPPRTHLVAGKVEKVMQQIAAAAATPVPTPR